MKKTVKFLILLTTCVMLLTSCSNMISVEKRKYRKGFYIEHAAKPSSSNTNSNALVAEKEQPVQQQVIVQEKKDSLPGEKVEAKEKFSPVKTETPGKNNSEQIRVTAKKKIAKPASSAPVNFKKHAVEKKNVPDEEEDDEVDDTGLVIFFIIVASFIIGVIVLGVVGLFLLLMGMELAALLVVICGVLGIVVIDFLIIQSVLSKRGKGKRRKD